MRHEAWEYSELIHSESHFEVRGYVGENYVDFIVTRNGIIFTGFDFTGVVLEYRGYVNPNKVWWKPWTWFRLTISEALDAAIAKCKKENTKYVERRKEIQTKKDRTKAALIHIKSKKEF